MPKRRHEESKEERWRRKKDKYERRLSKRNRRSAVIYSDEEDAQNEEHPIYDVTGDIKTPEAAMSPCREEYFYEEAAATAEPITAVDEGIVSTLPTAIEEVATAPSVDPTLLEALGDCYTEAPEWGDDIHQSISDRWEPILKSGLKKEIKDDFYKRYLYPKNVPSSKPPILNGEISAVITEVSRNRDSRLCSKQAQLGHAITALGRAMTGILTKNMETHEVLKILNDTGKIIADSHYLESDTRRSLITPSLDKSFLNPFKDRKRDNFLFGENLGEFVKSSQGIKKTGQLLTPLAPTTPVASNLNWKGPPRQHRNYRSQASRGGGYRASQPARRGPPQPAPPRRPAPPPGSRRPPPPTRVPSPFAARRARNTR